MAEVAFSFGAPALPDANDSDDYTLALRWNLLVAAPILGVEWRVPDTLPSGLCTAALWSDAGALLTEVDFTPSVAGQLLRVYFPAPYAAAVGVYRASVYTPNRYTATTGYGWPVSVAGVMETTVDNGYLSGSAAFPGGESGNGANFHVSPVVSVADAAVAQGSADVAFGFAVAAAGGRGSAGASALGFDLAVSAVGSSPSRGSAAVELALAVDVRSGRAVVRRPDVGVVARPFAGVVVRP